MSGRACSSARALRDRLNQRPPRIHREPPTVSARIARALRRVCHGAGRHRSGRHRGEPAAAEILQGDGVAAGGRQGRAVTEQRPAPPHSPAREAQLPADADGYHHQQESGAQGGAGPEARGEPFDTSGLRGRSGRRGIDRGLADRELAQKTQSGNLAEQRHSSSFSAADPRHSAAIANAFAKAYVNTMLELRVEPTREAAAWFDEQLKSLRANLEDAQAKLTDYHRQHGIVSDDERVDVDNTRLAVLSEQVLRAQEQALLWNTREQQARKFLERSGSVDRLPDVLDNPFIQKLKTDLLQGEAKLQELATQYGTNYPQYQRRLSENRSLREKLDAEMRKIVAGIESSARQSRQREAELRRALAAQHARVLGLKENRNELTVLKRNMESAERTYDTAMQRFVVSQVDSRASQTNVTVLSPAAVPLKPSRPNIILNIALSWVVGTMLGIGVVILMETFDRRVRSRGDFDNAWSVPLLGVLNAWRPAEHPQLGRPGGTGRALPNLGGGMLM